MCVWSGGRCLHAATTTHIYTKGASRYLPLHEGKLVQMFDHRAANIVINSANLHRPAQQIPTTEAQYRDPDYSPNLQFWVDAVEVQERLGDTSPAGCLGTRTLLRRPMYAP